MNNLGGYGKSISNKEAVFYLIKELTVILGVLAGIMSAIFGIILPAMAVYYLMIGNSASAIEFLIFGIVFAVMNRFVG